VADSATEARIKDLKRRLELEPGSRLFVALAEEFRKSGRLADALSTLQKGLLAHPNYLSAQVALGRAYLESGQITEAIATFSRVLSTDPGNLVSAKSLADIHMSRGDSVEAVKKYKLYRALSGDRTVDDIIERLEVELAPPPPPSAIEEIAPPPPPTFYDDKPPVSAIRSAVARQKEEGSKRPAEHDMTSVHFELDDSAPSAPREEAPLPLSRDVPLPAPARLAPAPPEEAQAVTRAIPPEEIAAALAAPTPEPTEPTPPPFAEPAPALFAKAAEPPMAAHPEASEVTHAALSSFEEEPEPPPTPEAPAEPQGRVLADLYFAQGHYAEALEIYDDLVAAHPHDEELRRLRRDAEARLLPAATTPAAAAPDPRLERRLAKIRALKRWLAVVQTG